MQYAGYLKAPGTPPKQIPEFSAKNDDEARKIVDSMVKRLTVSGMRFTPTIWERKDGKARYLTSK